MRTELKLSGLLGGNKAVELFVLHCLQQCRICFLLSGYYNSELSVLQIKISSAD